MKPVLILFLFICCFNFNNSFGQLEQAPFDRTIDFSDPQIRSTIDSIDLLTMGNMVYPDELKDPFLLALSRYPGLIHKRVEVVYKKINTTMASRPHMNFIFRKKGTRVYRIYINAGNSRRKSILYQNFSKNAQVGILGHELAHVADYVDKTNLGIVLYGLRLSSSKFTKKLEKSTDIEAIDRGFGWQVYDFSSSVLKNKKVSKEYKAF
jgi:hypothetical protein